MPIANQSAKQTINNLFLPDNNFSHFCLGFLNFFRSFFNLFFINPFYLTLFFLYFHFKSHQSLKDRKFIFSIFSLFFIFNLRTIKKRENIENINFLSFKL